MKTLLYTIFLLATLSVNAQETTWTKEEIKQVELFETTTEDHRGVRFQISDCENPETSIINALDVFFATQTKMDISTICISSELASKVNLDEIYDIHHLVKLYLENK